MQIRKCSSIIVGIIILLLTVLPAFAQGDSDGDGLKDSNDDCPNEAGPTANNGCPYGFTIATPVLDTDGDGIRDSNDQCPTVAGVRENNGCPPTNNPDPNDPPGSEPDPQRPDTDGDGIPDADDLCPTLAGVISENGCPESETPPFNPPILSNDACFVTTQGDFRARVRILPAPDATHIGNLLPGVIYPAEGIINTDDGQWIKLAGEFVHLDFEMWGGADGYVSDDVVNHSNCPELPEPQPPLCSLSVGYDSPTWSDNPAVPSYTYAAFWFAFAAGEPIPAGTPAWGVIYVADFITLPDSENIFAVAPDPATYEEALNSDYAGAYNWPTLAGGTQSGDTTLYRLTGDEGGSCGPIVGIDDLVIAPPIVDDGVQEIHQPINEYACTIITAFNWTFAFNYAPGDAIPKGTHPLAMLNGDPELAGDLNNWMTSLHMLDDSIVEYMDYPGWASFPRTGGDCGTIGGNDILVPTRNTRANGDSGDGGGDIVLYDFVIAYSDCNENGIDDLDEFLPPPCYGQLVMNNTNNSANQIGWEDCNQNGIHDYAEFPIPDCTIDDFADNTDSDNTARQGQSPQNTEDELNLTCGAGANWWYVAVVDDNGIVYVPEDGEHRGCDWESDLE